MRISNYITILIILSILLVPAVLAVPDCSNTGVDEMTCYDVIDVPYNTTTPLIIVDFHEIPVTILETTLTNKNSNKPFPIINVTGQQMPDEYNYTPKFHLENATYEFYLKAHDQDQNIIIMHTEFRIDAPGMEVYVNKPKNKHIAKPDFAVGATETFEFELKLGRPGNCAYSNTPIQNENGAISDFKNAYDTLSKFTQNQTNKELIYFGENGLINIANDFISGYNHDGETHSMYLVCKEDSTNRYTFKVIEVGSDGTAPEIRPNAIPSPITNSNKRTTNFTINTSIDRSICTINHTNILEGFAQIGTERYPGTRFTSGDNFTDLYYETILFNQRPPKYEYKFEIVCDNMANYRTMLNYTIPVDYQIGGGELLSPKGIINSTKYDFNITFVSDQDTCTYNVNWSNQGPKPLEFSGDYHNDGTAIYSVSLTGIQGEQKVVVECGLLANPQEFTIIVDAVKPPKPDLESNDNTCSDSSVTAKVNGTDDDKGSGIDNYEYNITLDTSNPDLEMDDITGSTSGAISENIPLGLIGEKLVIRAWAVDNAGHKGDIAQKTVTITNDTIPECDFSNPIINVNGTYDSTEIEWTITVNCTDAESGCLSTFDYSTHALDEECSYATTGKNLMSPVVLKNSSKFCARVYDKNKNNATYSSIFEVTYPITCYDNQTNGDETGVDCGGKCPGCGIDEKCNKDSDCADNYCAPNKTCQIPSCTDKIKNGVETDEDCGGLNICDRCRIGDMCEADSDCATKNCENNICAEPSCTNDKIDGEETDYDCGGTDCSKCTNGDSCLANSDCQSNYCRSDKKCGIDPSLDTDGDGLPDVWELEHFGCTTCADPNEDSDGDNYTNEEEQKAKTDPNDPNSIPNFKKLKPIGLILLILAILMIIGGIVLLVMEGMKRKQKEEEKQVKQYKEVMSDTPQIKTVLMPTIKPRELSKEEKDLSMQKRLQAIKERQAKRKSLFNEFTTEKSDYSRKTTINRLAGEEKPKSVIQKKSANQQTANQVLQTPGQVPRTAAQNQQKTAQQPKKNMPKIDLFKQAKDATLKTTKKKAKK